MKPLIPYLRVAAGFLAAIFVWVSIAALVRGEVGAGIAGLLMSAGLWYLAVGQPLRRRRARKRAEYDALAARADAAYAADLRGETVLPPRRQLRQRRRCARGS